MAAGGLVPFGGRDIWKVNIMVSKSTTKSNGTGDLAGANPFDLDALRLGPADADGFGVSKMLLRVPVEKPDKQDFFRLDPRPEFQLTTAILRLEKTKECFLVAPEVRPALPSDIRPAILRLGVYRNGDPFIWPIFLPADTTRRNPWHETAMAAAAQAEKRWVRIVWNNQIMAYDVFVPTVETPEPTWPEKTFSELLELAFGGDYLIKGLDHPVVRDLLGDCIYRASGE